MSKHLPNTTPRSKVRFRTRLADPRIVSWPTLAISSALLGYEVFFGSLALFALTQILVFGLLALARWIYL